MLAGKSVTAIVSGVNYNLALCSDHTVVAWGSNGTGGHGNGTYAASNVPVAVDSTGVLAGKIPIAIAASTSGDVLTADGTIAAWGDNQLHQLGNGTSNGSNVPMAASLERLGSGEKIIRMAPVSNGRHAMAIAAVPLSDDSQLSELALGGAVLDPVFDPSVTTYTARLSPGALAVTLTPTAAYGQATLTVNGTAVDSGTASSAIPATPGNAIVIRVIAEDGTSTSYEIVLRRDASLTSLELSDGALVASPPSPIVEIVAADEILDTGATLRGSVNANGTDVSISFEYGFTTAYGTTVAANPASASGTSTTLSSAMIDGLEPGQTYHYRVVATRPDLVTRSEDRTFTTTKLSALADLQLSQGTVSPAFSMIVRDYLATVPDDVASLAVTPVAFTPGAIVRVGGVVAAPGTASGSIPLAHGENRIEIEVTSPDGLQSRSYAVTVTRLPASFAFGSPHDVPLTVRELVAAGNIIGFALDHVPIPGARLMAVRNTGSDPIRGRFSNLEQGQLVYLVHDGTAYPYVADYHGGSGNDLVLHWAHNRLAAFGNNQHGKPGDGTVESRSAPIPVTDTGILDGKIVIDIKAGADHTVALCSDGTVVTWGDNSSGQLGRPGGSSNVPVAVDQSGVLAGKTVTAIAAGQFFSLALCSDGTLAAWGRNNVGQLGNGSFANSQVPVSVDQTGILDGKSVTSIVCGSTNSIALCSDGTLAMWGHGTSGSLGNGDTSHAPVPVAVDQSGVLAEKAVAGISAGDRHVLAWTPDGTLAGWGLNTSGQLGDDSTITRRVPVAVSDDVLKEGERFIAATSGYSHTIALVASPLPPLPLVEVMAATGVSGTSAVINGGVNARKNFLTLSFEFGIDQDYGNVVAPVPELLAGRLDTAVTGVLSGLQPGTTYHYRLVAASHGWSVASENMTFTTLSDNARLASIDVSRGILGPDFINENGRYFVSVPHDVESMVVNAVTDHPGASLEINGMPVAGGSASPPISLLPGTTQIAIHVTAEDGITTKSYAVSATRLPERFAFDSAVDAILTVDGFSARGTMADLKLNFAPATGALLTVVRNTGLAPIVGEFSNLAHGERITLTHDGVDYDFVANYFGGDGNDLVLHWADTDVYGWGLNSHCKLGDGGTANGSAMVRASIDGATVFEVATGYLHSLALRSDGRVASWGYNLQGQLGLGDYDHRHTPLIVPAIGALEGKTVVAVAAGAYHSLALCDDGTVASLGFNNHGQLGNGTRETSAVSVAVRLDGVLAGKRVVAIAAGSYHSLALCSDGTVAAWGYNDEGQLGDGTSAGSAEPVVTSIGGRKAVMIRVGQYHTLALCDDGGLMAWGYNGRGQLGDGTTSDRHLPVDISTSGALVGKTLTSFSAGGMHTLAVADDGALIVWGANPNGQLGAEHPAQLMVPTPSETVGHQVFGGAFHSLGFDPVTGVVTAWGRNQHGQLGANGLPGGLRKTHAATGPAASHNLAIVALPSVTVTPDGVAADPAAMLFTAFGLARGDHGGLPRPRIDGGDLVVRFARDAVLDGYTVGAEWSATLEPGSWQALPDTGDAGDHEFRLRMLDHPAAFMRLRVAAQP